MRLYVLTRSAYGPAWSRAANASRLEITRAVGARLMARQTDKDWTWVVLLDPRDPFLKARMEVYEAAAPRFVPFIWLPEGEPPRRDPHVRQRAACADYKAPWRKIVGPADDRVLQIRIDDDDGFTADALARYRRAAEGITVRTILMLPRGVRVWRGRYFEIRHPRNAMHCLVTPPGDDGCVYDYSHTKVGSVAPVRIIDEDWAWIWVRHSETISNSRAQDPYCLTREQPIRHAVRSTFPVDWGVLARSWGTR